MGRPERPLDPLNGPVERLAWQLRQLRNDNGRPSYRRLAQQAHFSASTLAEAAKGQRFPSLEVTLAYAAACGGDPDEWTDRWHATAAELERNRRSAGQPERPPHPGLAAPRTEDTDVFPGRADSPYDLMDAVRRYRLVALFGASGGGRSSLLRAGFLDALTDLAGAPDDRATVIIGVWADFHPDRSPRGVDGGGQP